MSYFHCFCYVFVLQSYGKFMRRCYINETSVCSYVTFLRKGDFFATFFQEF